MSDMTEEECLKHKENPNIIVTINGKQFFCNCGCNVFHHPSRDKSIYKCNSCGTEYEGE